MKALFVANIEMQESEGIYKKVNAEADAIAQKLGECELITKNGKSAKIKKVNGKVIVTQQSVLDYVERCTKNNELDFLYIRHMIPSFRLLSLLRISKKNGIKVYYEIPTYPYFGEQFKASRRKYRAIAKIGLDVIFAPLIYNYIDKLVVIRSNSKAKTYKKMYEITNGVRTDDIRSKNYEEKWDGIFRMVTVGTLFPYHGYDRVLKGLRACNEVVDNVPVEFHVIGASQTIDDLHQQANSLGLKNVFFHGMKTTAELNDMYEKYDVGLGCLALHRRNADIDTTLKVVEYYCRGIPVISTGKCPLKDERFSHIVEDSEAAVDIADIFHYFRGLKKEELQSLSGIAKHQFAWESIMEDCLSDL